jgi:hypothetical protein
MDCSFDVNSQIKEMKETAMNALSPYGRPQDHREDPGGTGEQIDHPATQPFVSLLELVKEIYQVSLSHSYSEIKSVELKTYMIW